MTTPTLSRERIAQLRNRFDGTSPGEWRAIESGVTHHYQEGGAGSVCEASIKNYRAYVDAAWIAETHNAFDALLSLAERTMNLEAENAQLRDQLAALPDQIAAYFRAEHDRIWTEYATTGLDSFRAEANGMGNAADDVALRKYAKQGERRDA